MVRFIWVHKRLLLAGSYNTFVGQDEIGGQTTILIVQVEIIRLDNKALDISRQGTFVKNWGHTALL